MNNQPASPGQRRRWWTKVPERYLRRIALVSVIVVTAMAFVLLSSLELSAREALGYPALFLLVLLSNATVILPVPAILAICTAGVTLAPVLVGVVSGAGMALGETTGYLAGFSGSNLASKSNVYRRIQPWMQRRGWMVVLAFGMVPNPFFDIAGLAAGATRMPMWKFFAATWAGKTVMATVTAYGCAWGFDLFRVLAEKGV